MYCNYYMGCCADYRKKAFEITRYHNVLIFRYDKIYKIDKIYKMQRK